MGRRAAAWVAASANLPEGGGGLLKRSLRTLTVALLAAGLVAAVWTMGAAAATVTTCTDVLAPGTYQRVVVPAGATCLSDGPVTISSGLFVDRGATFVLGSGEAPGDNGTISGGVHSTHAASVQIHFVTINGGVGLLGGSGPFGGPFGMTWNTIEDSQINGHVLVAAYNGFWLGFIRNSVIGSVVFVGNVLPDPDGNEYVTNTIQGNLLCFGNSPAPQIGDSEGSPNVVTGRKLGQCANL
jgi:hypothetical protein